MSQKPFIRRLSERALDMLIGVKGANATVEFMAGGRKFQALVPDDSLWGVVSDILLLGSYERAGIKLENFRGTVVDAGAHAGLFSLVASAHARSVLALEPHPGNHELLSKNVEANGANNVTVLKKALWSSSSPVALSEGSNSMGPYISNEGELNAEGITLADLAGGRDIDLLKLDIEGAEANVLTAARDEDLLRIGAVVIEVHGLHDPFSADRIRNRLTRLGFSVDEMPPAFLTWRDSMRQLRGSRRRVRHQKRLKAAVALAITGAALLRPFGGLRRKLNAEDLSFIYARRR